MKATFITNKLLTAIDLPCAASGTFLGLDIYKYVRFEIKNVNGTHNIKCTGNSGSNETISYALAESGDELCFLVEGRKFKDLVSTYDKKAVITITQDKDDHIVIQCGRSKQKLSILPEKDFPAFADTLKTAEVATATVQTSVFCFGLERVGIARGTGVGQTLQNALLYLNVQINQDGLLFTATNGAMLSQFKVPCQVDGVMDSVALLDQDLVSKILAMKGKADNLEISFDKNMVRLRIGDNIISAALGDLPYPPLNSLKQAMPKDFVHTVDVSVSELKNAISRIKIITASSSKSTGKKSLRSVKLFNGEGSTINICDNSMGADQEAFESIDVDVIKSDAPLLVGYSAEILGAILNQIKSPKVTFKMDNKNTTIIEDHNNKGQPILVLPVNV